MQEKTNTFKEEVNKKIKEIEKEYKINKLDNYCNDNEDLDELENWIYQHYYIEFDDFFYNYKNQICVTIQNIKTNEIYNKFFNQEKISPKRESTTPLSYIIYSLSQIDDYVIFIGCNLFKSHSQTRRTQENVLFSKSLYLDIDHVKGAENLNWNSKEYNQQLLELFYKNYPVSKYIPPSEIVASGTGLHLYFYIDTFLFTKESKYNYVEVMRELGKLYNSDSSCVDTARILRPVNSYNRKEKFTEPKKVELLENTAEKYSLSNLDNLIKYCKEKFNTEDKAKKNKSKLGRKAQAKQRVKKEKTNPNDNFELSDYEENTNYPSQYLIQDLLYFMKNRNFDCEGVRHKLLYCFYFAFKKYCLMDSETVEAYLKSVNDLFVNPLDEEEYLKMLNKLNTYELYNGITNLKVKSMLNMVDDEIKYMRGTYTNNQTEKREIKLERDRRIVREKYKHKKPTQTEVIKCILNNPTKSDSEISKLLNINRTTVYRHRKALEK